MKIASFNTNGIRACLSLITQWLENEVSEQNGGAVELLSFVYIKNRKLIRAVPFYWIPGIIDDIDIHDIPLTRF